MPEHTTSEIVPHEQVLLIVVLPSRLDSAKATALEDEVSRAVLDVARVPLVLDLFNVTFAPSVALGALVNVFKGMKLAGRRAFVINATQHIRGALSVTGLDALIDVRYDLSEVLEACQAK